MPSTTLKHFIATNWRTTLIAAASVGLSACVATEDPPVSSSSAAESSNSIVIASSSSVVSISSSSVAESSAVAASSSSESQALGDIIPRTSCPSAPPESKPVDLAGLGPYDLSISKDEYVAMLEDKGSFDGSRGSLPWHMYTPDQAMASPDEKYPLIVSLHGGYGREGEDHHILQDGVPYMLGSSNGLLTTENKSKFPTFIIFPHCREYGGFRDCSFYSNEWSSGGGADYQVQSQPSQNGQTLIELIEHAIDNYNIDPARIYVTGVSMGGGGSWELAQRRPDLVAAAIPLAGHTPGDQYLSTFSNSLVPVWAHAGERDNTNSYNDTVQAVNKIDGDGGCAWLSSYDGYQRGDQYSMAAHGHSLWQRVYLNPDLWPWLFAQKQPRSNEVATSSSVSTSSSAGGSSGGTPISGQGCNGAEYCNDFDGLTSVPGGLMKAACANNAFAEPKFSIVSGKSGSAVKVETTQAYCSGWLAAPGVENMDKFFVKFDVNVTDPKGNLRWFLLLENATSQTDTDKSQRLRLPQHAATDYLNWNIGNPESDTPKVYDGGPNGERARNASLEYEYNQWNCMEVMVDKVGREIGLWVNGVRLDGLTIDENSDTDFDAQWPDSLRNFDVTGVNIGMHDGSVVIDNLVVSSSPVGCG